MPTVRTIVSFCPQGIDAIRSAVPLPQKDEASPEEDDIYIDSLAAWVESVGGWQATNSIQFSVVGNSRLSAIKPGSGHPTCPANGAKLNVRLDRLRVAHLDAMFTAIEDRNTLIATRSSSDEAVGAGSFRVSQCRLIRRHWESDIGCL